MALQSFRPAAIDSFVGDEAVFFEIAERMQYMINRWASVPGTTCPADNVDQSHPRIRTHNDSASGIDCTVKNYHSAQRFLKRHMLYK